MVEFDMADENRPIIGIAKLNLEFSPVQSSVLRDYQLRRSSVQRLKLLQGEETMFPAHHLQCLDQVDQIPIWNKKVCIPRICHSLIFIFFVSILFI